MLLKLESITIESSDLRSVEDCAFCNLTNLKTVDLNRNFHLSFIDENAFGFTSNGTSPAVEHFGIAHCNIPAVSERLLDWKNLATVAFLGNAFACDCSMDWLINDVKSPTPKYPKLRSHLKCQKNSGHTMLFRELSECSTDKLLNICEENSLGKFSPKLPDETCCSPFGIESHNTPFHSHNNNMF